MSGDPHVRFGGRGHRSQSMLPTPMVTRRNRQRNLDQSAVLPLANGFKMIDAIIAQDTVKNRVLLVFMLRWDEDGHRLANGLLGQIAKEPLRALIPARGDGIKVRAYYCVITGFDNGSEPPKLLPAFAQRRFYFIAFDEVRRLSSKHVQGLQFAFGGGAFSSGLRSCPIGGPTAP
jgi:hypothetical protein